MRVEAITAARKEVTAVSWAGVFAKRKRSNQILITLTRRKNDNRRVPRAPGADM